MSKAKQSTVSNIQDYSQVDSSTSSIEKNKYHPKDLCDFSPTEKQTQFIKAFEKDIPIISQTGSTGTGKTYTALYQALKAVFDQSVYQRVVIVRSAVETRKIGYQPGNESEKMGVYERPYRDIVEEIIQCDNRSGHYENLKKLGYIEYMGTSFVRGISLHNSILIVDETQNQDLDELWSVITRAGKNTKVILCGDLKQDDLKRSREKSGFTELSNILDIVEDMKSSDTPSLPTHRNITYTHEDIVRCELVKNLIIARELYDERMNELKRLSK